MTHFKIAGIGAVVLGITLLTGCAGLSSAETAEITPAMVRYPGPDESFLNNDAQWVFVNDDHQEVKLTCVDPGFFDPTICSDEAGTVSWEPHKTKSSRYGYLELPGEERVKLRCTTNFEGFEDLDAKNFCYER